MVCIFLEALFEVINMLEKHQVGNPGLEIVHFTKIVFYTNKDYVMFYSFDKIAKKRKKADYFLKKNSMKRV